MRIDPTYQARPQALDSIRVSLGDPDLDGDAIEIGSGAAAITDPRVTHHERAAVRHVARAIESIHDRFGYGGFDDADGAIRIVLRYHKGPEASFDGKLRLPVGNPFEPIAAEDVRTGVMLTRDAAYHELVHVLQTQLSGHVSGQAGEQLGAGADVITPAAAKGVREGLADALTALDERSWKSGGGYFREDGRAIDVARDFADPTSPRALMEVETHYEPNRFADATLDPHATGGVVVAFARELQQGSDWRQAQDVLWGVLQDPDFQRSEQAWDDLASALERRRDASEAPLADAIDGALRGSGLDAELTHS